MNRAAAVSLREVSKVIDKKTIIDKLNLDIYPGEVFGLLGPNGAGKTTTIRMIVGLMKMTEGEILIQNHNISKNFIKAIREVGAIVENPELYDYLTGYQNLKHFANMIPEIGKERIIEVARLVGLEKRMEDKVRTYSLGMRQRLGLAQALLHNPSVLILDEPSNGLDPAGIRELREYLRSLAREKHTAVIVSSHLLSEMEMMCDRVAVIQNGKLLEVKEMHDWIGGQEEMRRYKFKVSQPGQAMARLKEWLPQTAVNLEKMDIILEAVPDVVAGANAWLVKNGFQVYGITPENKTLEDRFLEMTGER